MNTQPETLAAIQAKLVAAQNCHPNAVQVLIGEALDALDSVARAGTQAPDWSQLFDAWWHENGKTHRIKSAQGFARKAYHAGVLAGRRGE